MKVGWFTPVGEDDPGAEYSRAVLAAMAELCDPLLCCDRPSVGFPPGIPVLDFAAAPHRLPDLRSLDAIFYVLGNDLDSMPGSSRRPGRSRGSSCCATRHFIASSSTTT